MHTGICKWVFVGSGTPAAFMDVEPEYAMLRGGGEALKKDSQKRALLYLIETGVA